MKYKTAFRLAIRLIGVLLFFMQLPGLITAAATIAGSLIEENSLTSGATFFSWPLMFYIPQLLGSLVGVACGLYLFFSGAWIVDRAIPSNRPYCAECGYELSGLTEESVCPECGIARVK